MIVRLAASKDLIKIDAETKFGLLQNLGNLSNFSGFKQQKMLILHLQNVNA